LILLYYIRFRPLYYALLRLSISHIGLDKLAEIRMIIATLALRSLAPRLQVQSPQSILSISKRLNPKHGLQQSTHLTDRSLSAIYLPGRFNRPFLSSPPQAISGEEPEEGPESIGMEWYELSAERKIQWLVGPGCDSKWGWLIYRCTYNPELSRHWESLTRLIDESTRRSVAQSDAPDIAEKLEWVFVEGPELEGASLEELKHKFRAWARSEAPNYDIDNTTLSRGSRHTYFIQVDEVALRSLLNDPENPTNTGTCVNLDKGHVNIAWGWKNSDPAEETRDEFSEVDNEDWMKMKASMIASYFYVDLDNDESWYTHYSPPPHGMCIW
jgi:hypothetical protein